MPDNIALGSERLVVSNAAVSFASIPAGTQSALIRVSGGTICFTEDGTTTPTTTVGMTANDGDVISLTTDPRRFKAIRQGSVDVTLIITYYESTS